MTKSIYKITNLINGKIYIGQSVDPQKRFKQHKGGRGSPILYAAIEKYGVENFSFEVIESDIENYNEREKYWIQYYNATKPGFGYNIQEGGEEPPIFYGENSNLAMYSDETVEKILLEMRDTNKTFKEIAKEFGTTEGFISDLNYGHRKNSKFTYPIRIQPNMKYSDQRVNEIVRELIYTTKSQAQIARERGIGRRTIWEINEGTFHDCPKDFEYPLRLKGSKYSRLLIKAVVKELQDNQHDFKWIEQTFNLSHNTLSRFNQGKIYPIPNFSYPIRPSSMRVYNPVETIPSEMGSRAAIDKQLCFK